MKKIYLVMAVVGFIIPTLLMIQESLATGNILLYADLASTFQGMFANRISTIFSIDLLIAVFVFFFWSFQEARKLKVSNYWMIWIWTMLFGFASGLPLFLYLREVAVEKSSH